jgi:hypothetical protein
MNVELLTCDLPVPVAPMTAISGFFGGEHAIDLSIRSVPFLLSVVSSQKL